MKVEFEPFVYTSMASHFGTGYHLVIRGKTLFSDDKGLNRVETCLSDLAQVKAGDSTVRAYTVVDEVGILIQVRPLERDWVGRQGRYCTALAFPLDQADASQSRSVLAIEEKDLPFISHDKAVSLDHEHGGGKLPGALRLSALSVEVPATLLRKTDLEWFKEHDGLVMAAAEALSKGPPVSIRTKEEKDAFARWLTAITPPAGRVKRTFVIGPAEVASIAADFLLGPIDAKRESRDQPHIVEVTDTSRPRSETFKQVGQMLVSQIQGGISIESVMSAFVDQLGDKEYDMQDFLQLLSEHRRAETVLDRDDSASASPDDLASALHVRWRMDRASFRTFIEHNASGWMGGKIPWLSELVAGARSRSEDFGNVLCDMLADVAAAKQDSLSLADFLSATESFPSLWDVGTRYAEKLFASNKLAVTAETIDAVCAMRDPQRRAVGISMLAGAVPRALVGSRRFRDSFSSVSDSLSVASLQLIYEEALRSGETSIRRWATGEEQLLRCAEPADTKRGILPADSATAELLVSGLHPNAAIAFEWWQAWPGDDEPGRRVWEEYLCRNHMGLSAQQLFSLIDASRKRAPVDQRVLESLLKTCFRKARVSDSSAFFVFLRRFAGNSAGMEADWLTWLVGSTEANTTLMPEARKRLNVLQKRGGSRHRSERRGGSGVRWRRVRQMAMLLLSLSVTIILTWRVTEKAKRQQAVISAAVGLDEYMVPHEFGFFLADVMRIQQDDLPDDPFFAIRAYKTLVEDYGFTVPDIDRLWRAHGSPACSGLGDVVLSLGRLVARLEPNEPVFGWSGRIRSHWRAWTGSAGKMQEETLLLTHLKFVLAFNERLTKRPTGRFEWVDDHDEWVALATVLPTVVPSDKECTLEYLAQSTSTTATAQILLRIHWRTEELSRTMKEWREDSDRQQYKGEQDQYRDYFRANEAQHALAQKHAPRLWGSATNKAARADQNAALPRAGASLYRHAKTELQSAFKKAGDLHAEELARQEERRKVSAAAELYRTALVNADLDLLSRHVPLMLAGATNTAMRASKTENTAEAIKLYSYATVDLKKAGEHAARAEREEAKMSLARIRGEYVERAGASAELLVAYGGVEWESLKEAIARDGEDSDLAYGVRIEAYRQCVERLPAVVRRAQAARDAANLRKRETDSEEFQDPLSTVTPRPIGPVNAQYRPDSVEDHAGEPSQPSVTAASGAHTSAGQYRTGTKKGPTENGSGSPQSGGSSVAEKSTFWMRAREALPLWAGGKRAGETGQHALTRSISAQKAVLLLREAGYNHRHATLDVTLTRNSRTTRYALAGRVKGRSTRATLQPKASLPAADGSYDGWCSIRAVFNMKEPKSSYGYNEAWTRRILVRQIDGQALKLTSSGTNSPLVEIRLHFSVKD